MDRSGDDVTLRSWCGPFTTTLAFPLAGLVAALLVFATADLSVGLVGGLVVALVPWALLAGGIRLGPWTMVLGGVGIPAAVVVGYGAIGATFLAMLAVAWLAADGRSRLAEVIALAGSVAMPIAATAAKSGVYRNAWIFMATGSLFSWFAGRMLRRERQLVEALTEAHSRLHDASAAAERQRIARDVHDLVGHSLTVVLLNVMGARRVLTVDPRSAAEALQRAEQVGRDSLEGVRAVVALLRTPGDAGPSGASIPGTGDIAALVRTAAEAGLPVHIEAEGDLLGVDSQAGLAAFRLVQEAITNVEHHAPGATVVVRVVSDGEYLRVSVHNGAADRPLTRSGGGGAGLVGMRERITALGGKVSAGPDGDGWRVEGSIPLRRADAPVSR